MLHHHIFKINFLFEFITQKKTWATDASIQCPHGQRHGSVEKNLLRIFVVSTSENPIVFRVKLYFVSIINKNILT